MSQDDKKGEVQTGYFVEFTPGWWAKKGDGPATRNTMSGQVYHGSVTKEQVAQLTQIVRDFLNGKEAPTSAERAQEGYPGIAHDFETMRSALVQIRDECFNGHAHDIAEAALNAAPQAVSGDTEGGTGRTRGVIENDRRAGRPAALKSSDADLEPEDLPGRVERDRSIGHSPDSQPAVAAPTSANGETK